MGFASARWAPPAAHGLRAGSAGGIVEHDGGYFCNDIIQRGSADPLEIARQDPAKVSLPGSLRSSLAWWRRQRIGLSGGYFILCV
jgi:hypothetical protein